MSDQSNLHEDISFLRKLAESGRRGQILGGVFLAGAGIVFGLASFASWALREHLLPGDGLSEYRLWMIAGAVFAAFWLLMFLRFRATNPSVGSATSATFGVVWGACGAGVMVAFGTTLVVADRLAAPVILTGFVPVIFVFYGCAWLICGFTAKRSWMYTAGMGSFLFAFIIAILTASSLQAAAMGLGLLLLLTVPGIRLMLDEARA